MPSVFAQVVAWQFANVAKCNDICSYKHVFDGLYQVATKEGIPTLFNGVGMATARAILITNGQVFSSRLVHCYAVLNFKL